MPIRGTHIANAAGDQLVRYRHTSALGDVIGIARRLLRPSSAKDRGELPWRAVDGTNTLWAVRASQPPPEIRGRQVLVRRYTLNDAGQLHEAISASVDHLVPWMPWARLEPLHLPDRQQLIGGWIEQWDRGEDFNYGVFRGDQLVGSCDLHRRVGPRGLEIGYWTRATALRHGIATDAAGCLIDAAFSMSGLEFVEIHHDAANTASGAVPDRLGFTLVDERPNTVEAPAEIGSEQVWRLDRTDRTTPVNQ